MTAAAGASKAAQAVVGDQPTGGAALIAWSLIVAGGLVEGTALGLAQGAGLAGLLDQVRRLRWLQITLLLAGLGWAVASAPAVLSGDDDGAAPAMPAVLAGAALLGLAMGAVLGAVQSRLLRNRVSHPRRWISISAAAWAPTMTVIFLGAMLPDADWSVAAVIGTAAVTGALAGALLGLVSGGLLPYLNGCSMHNSVVLRLLASPFSGLLERSVVGVRIVGRRTGRTIRLPVMFASDDSADARLVVMVGQPQGKQWWRNVTEVVEVEVLVKREWRAGTARVLPAGSAEESEALTCYGRRWPRVRLSGDERVVCLELEPGTGAAPSSRVSAAAAGSDG